MHPAPLTLTLATALFVGSVGGWILRDGAVPEDFLVPPEPTYVPGFTQWVYEGPILPWSNEPLAGSSVAAAPTWADAALPEPILPPGASVDLSSVPQGVRITSDLSIALADGTLRAEFNGNGRDRLQMTMVNRSRQPLRLSIPAGQVFRGANGRVLIPRALFFDFAPGESRLEEINTLAVSSMNRVVDSVFVVVDDRVERLNDLLRMLKAHPEVSLPVAQTAALALLENLPVGSIAKFAATDGAQLQPWDTTAFRVDTADLIGALALLRRLGLPDEQIAMTIDPQTRIEAMLDPLARAQAMHYYGIAPDQEWAYWKRELLEGDPRMRHYALHGIGRYFPEVALEMLPSWVREKRTTEVFRRTAVLALTETQRPEALELLKALQVELANQTDLSIAIAEAMTYLEASLERNARGGRLDFRVVFHDVPPLPTPSVTSIAGETAEKPKAEGDNLLPLQLFWRPPFAFASDPVQRFSTGEALLSYQR